MSNERVNVTIEVDEELYEKYKSLCAAYGYSPEEDLERFMRFFVEHQKEIENFQKQKITAEEIVEKIISEYLAVYY